MSGLNKKVIARLEKGAVVTLTRADGKAATGKVVIKEDGTLSVRTGMRGRPLTMLREQVSAITFAETAKRAPKPVETPVLQDA